MKCRSNVGSIFGRFLGLRQCSNWLREVIFGTQSSWFFVYGRVLRNVSLPEVTQPNNILSYKVGGKDDLS